MYLLLWVNEKELFKYITETFSQFKFADRHCEKFERIRYGQLKAEDAKYNSVIIVMTRWTSVS